MKRTRSRTHRFRLNPFDLIPDALPLLGLVDDAAVVSACLSLVEQDLRKYRTWRQAHPEASTLNDPDTEKRISS